MPAWLSQPPLHILLSTPLQAREHQPESFLNILLCVFCNIVPSHDILLDFSLTTGFFSFELAPSLLQDRCLHEAGISRPVLPSPPHGGGSWGPEPIPKVIHGAGLATKSSQLCGPSPHGICDGGWGRIPRKFSISSTWNPHSCRARVGVGVGVGGRRGTTTTRAVKQQGRRLLIGAGAGRAAARLMIGCSGSNVVGRVNASNPGGGC